MRRVAQRRINLKTKKSYYETCHTVKYFKLIVRKSTQKMSYETIKTCYKSHSEFVPFTYVEYQPSRIMKKSEICERISFA